MHDAFGNYQKTEQGQQEEERSDSPVFLVSEGCLEEHHQPGAISGLDPGHTVMRQVFLGIKQIEESTGDREGNHQQIEKTMKLFPQNLQEEDVALYFLLQFGIERVFQH